MIENKIGTVVNTFDTARSLRQGEQGGRSTRNSVANSTETAVPSSGRDSAVNIDLSPKAREILSALGNETAETQESDAKGRAAAPGQVARETLGLTPKDGRAFGQAVSLIARGIDPADLEPPADEAPTSDPDVTDPSTPAESPESEDSGQAPASGETVVDPNAGKDIAFDPQVVPDNPDPSLTPNVADLIEAANLADTDQAEGADEIGGETDTDSTGSA